MLAERKWLTENLTGSFPVWVKTWVKDKNGPLSKIQRNRKTPLISRENQRGHWLWREDLNPRLSGYEERAPIFADLSTILKFPGFMRISGIVHVSIFRVLSLDFEPAVRQKKDSEQMDNIQIRHIILVK